MVLLLQFTAFDIGYNYKYNRTTMDYDYSNLECYSDQLTIMDGDGTTLLDKVCGSSSTEILYYDYDPSTGTDYYSSMGSGLPNITSSSNIVKFMFVANDYGMVDGGLKSGWSVSWSAVAP